jgi:hypothetical protein
MGVSSIFRILESLTILLWNLDISQSSAREKLMRYMNCALKSTQKNFHLSGLCPGKEV